MPDEEARPVSGNGNADAVEQVKDEELVLAEKKVGEDPSYYIIAVYLTQGRQYSQYKCFSNCRPGDKIRMLFKGPSLILTLGVFIRTL